MAPTGVDFLDSLTSAEGGRAPGISEDPGVSEMDTGVKDENSGVFEAERVFGEVEESLKCTISIRVVGSGGKSTYHHQV